MQLVACAEPEGPLETAPTTALLARGEALESASFWGRDDRYYARVVEGPDTVRWYTLDDSDADLAEPSVVAIAGGRRVTLVARATRAHGGALVWATGTRRRG